MPELWIPLFGSMALAGVLLVDSSGLLAAIDAGEPDHSTVQEYLRTVEKPLVVTDFIIAEVDYLVLKRLGWKAEEAFIKQLLEGVFTRESVTDRDLKRAYEISKKYHEHNFGLTDATLMAVSERLVSREVLTLDREHFRVYRDHRGRALEILPSLQ